MIWVIENNFRYWIISTVTEISETNCLHTTLNKKKQKSKGIKNINSNVILKMIVLITIQINGKCIEFSINRFNV